MVEDALLEQKVMGRSHDQYRALSRKRIGISGCRDIFVAAVLLGKKEGVGSCEKISLEVKAGKKARVRFEVKE